MRDRLVELLSSPTQPWEYLLCKSNIKALADYLLANGVIVPSCKVGDKVYFLHNFDELCEARIINTENNFYTTPQLWITVEFYSKVTGTNTYKSRIDLMLNRMLFLTKEEAEAKLKEGVSNA